jgi:transcriptional regulator with XRE-family HTH domain
VKPKRRRSEKTLAGRLVALRAEAGISQVELAELVGVQPGTVGDWETGRCGIRLSRLAKVARVLKTSVPYLIGDGK